MPQTDRRNGTNDAQRLRERLIAELPPYLMPGPRIASTVYVWPTAVCPVGCGHCNFASPVRRNGNGTNRVGRYPAEVTEFVNALGSWKVVLSGGGEPMDELDFVYAFVARVRPEGLREIEIITSGMFGADPDTARVTLRRLADAFASRPDVGEIRFKLRLSVDWFHAERIGLNPIVNIVQTIAGSELRDVFDVYIRSVLIADDTTMLDLANRLGGTLSGIVDFQQAIQLRDGSEIPVYYKNLIVDGRMSWRRMESRGIRLDATARADQFVQRFVDERGKHVPARTYNGPQVEHLDGLALIVENDGSVKILEGNAPDRVPSMFSHSWDECLDYLYADPITIFLIEEGPQDLAELLQDHNPRGPSLLTGTNQLYYLADKLLGTPERRLLATSRIVHQHARTGRLPLDPDWLASIQREVDACLAS